MGGASSQTEMYPGSLRGEIFRDRREAGRQLAERALEVMDPLSDAIVLALPRGGVPVADEIAKRLGVPLDVIVVRKLGVPGQEELAFGAIASGDVRVLNPQIVRMIRLTDDAIEHIVERERTELTRRESAYRGDRPYPDVKGRTVILVDDGLATGATMRAAVKAVKAMDCARVIVAVPVAPLETLNDIERTDGITCISKETPAPFYGVGMWYRDFSQTTDEEVVSILSEAWKQEASSV